MKIAFIVEGVTEATILSSKSFTEYLIGLDLGHVLDIIDVKGSGNLLPHKLQGRVANLARKGGDKIVILTDLDSDACITKTKRRVDPGSDHSVVVAVKEIEAWFLADTQAARRFLDSESFYIKYPENVVDPFLELNKAREKLVGKKARSKVILANEMILSGFSIIEASKHPNCPSARYFLKKLGDLARQN